MDGIRVLRLHKLALSGGSTIQRQPALVSRACVKERHLSTRTCTIRKIRTKLGTVLREGVRLKSGRSGIVLPMDRGPICVLAFFL